MGPGFLVAPLALETVIVSSNRVTDAKIVLWKKPVSASLNIVAKISKRVSLDAEGWQIKYYMVREI